MDDQPQPASHDQNVFDEDDVVFTPREREMIAEGLADIAAGRLVPWEDVQSWIDSLSTDAPRPPPFQS